MSGDAHVRICESLGVRFPWATRPLAVFEREEDVHRFMRVLPKRLGTFGLRVNP